MSDKTPPTTYWDYIRIEDLLSLQGGLDSDEDSLSGEEVVFITVHQVFELWFKLCLRELVAARDLFMADRVDEQKLSGVVRRLTRVTTILRVATHHFEVVETLGTREYLEFRNKLMPASGFQSAQMRELEVVLGLEESERVPLGPPGGHLAALRSPGGGRSPALDRVEARMAGGPTLKNALENWLCRTPIDGTEHGAPDADERLVAFAERYLEAHAAEADASLRRAFEVAAGGGETEMDRLREMYAKEKLDTRAFLLPTGDLRRTRVRTAMVFIETYRELPLLAWPREVLAAILELEQAFLVFRQRHARMVERVIGRRAGTGGSAGVDYLDRTALSYRIYRDLWAVRTLLVRAEAAPRLERAGYYDFKSV